MSDLSTVSRWRWRANEVVEDVRVTAEEVAVALVYDGGTEAVMMASPADLEDFALGFSLNEGLIAQSTELESIERIDLELGIEMRMRLNSPRGEMLIKRRRMRMGPVGCGLCGIESLEEALAPPPAVSANRVIEPGEIIAAMCSMTARQRLNEATRAVHAAAFYSPDVGLIAIREDVGRHNALDKLAGALAQLGMDASAGVILLSSRLSVDLVQKAARMRAGMLASVSAPTGLAVRTADKAKIAIAAIVRADGLEIFTYPERFGLSRDHHAS